MERKWSVFFGKYIQLIHEYFEEKNSEPEVTNNTVIFKFKDKIIRKVSTWRRNYLQVSFFK
jgi:hypothetical protein